MTRVNIDFPFQVGDTDLVELGVMESMEGVTFLNVPQHRLTETLQALVALGVKPDQTTP